ncbi:MAG: dihydroorotate dehydrogenase-like protein, partial [Anaerolineales bacterium]|nr:dihydroorotate dehydrogenase-like protein [Anaerolineales bacterium]
MIDLKTNYLGIDLKNPLVASSSPLMEEIGNIKRMEDAGASAVILHSLFEEQITLESYDIDETLFQGTDYFAEALSYFPDMTHYNLGPGGYLEHIRKAKAAVDIPVIASMNGVSSGGWIAYASEIEEAGADALELNIYYLPTELNQTASEIEEMYISLARNIRAAV